MRERKQSESKYFKLTKTSFALISSSQNVKILSINKLNKCYNLTMVIVIVLLVATLFGSWCCPVFGMVEKCEYVRMCVSVQNSHIKMF